MRGYRKEDDALYFYPGEPVLAQELRTILRQVVSEIDESFFPPENIAITKAEIARILCKVFKLTEENHVER